MALRAVFAGFSLIILLVAATSIAAVAQLHAAPLGNSGIVSGAVRGADDLPLNNARVELRDLHTGATFAATYSHPNGSFEIYNIPLGNYEVVALSGLYEARERVDIGQAQTFVSLRIAQVAENSTGNPTVSVAELKVPEKARQEAAKARKALEARKNGEAQKHIAEALQIAPQFAEALTLRGIVRMNESKLNDALSDFDQAIHSDPNYATAYLALGAAYNQLGKYDEAQRTLDRGLAMSPNSWQGYFELGKSNLGKGDFEAALRNVNKAEQRLPHEFAPLHLVKAHALLGMKLFREAVGELEMYLRQAPAGEASSQAREALDKARAFAARSK